MRILEVVPTIEIAASGPSYSVPRLATALAARGHDVKLMTVGAGELDALSTVPHQSYAKDWRNIPVLKSLWCSRAMRTGLDLLAENVDLIHSNGLWVMPAVYPGWAANLHGKPLVVSPRGTFSPIALSISPFKKRVFWRLLQGQTVRRAACIHVTSEQEYLDCRRFGLKQPVAIIPNGIDILDFEQPQRSPGKARRLLYLGRLHPIKGLENLLEAWANIYVRYPDWELRLIGPGEEAYVAGLQRLIAERNLGRVTLEGPRYGADKNREYAEADLYVLPSFSENFGMSVAEALAFSVPVVTTTGTPWGGLTENECGWWVQPYVSPLAGALSDAMEMNPEALRGMGVKGRIWMERSFSWKHIAQQMEATYRWLIEGGSAPEMVHLT